MFKKYSKTLAMMLGAFMLFAISMNANSTSTVGTSVDKSFDTEISTVVDFSTETSSYSSGRSLGRKVGAAVGRVAFIATLAYQVASDFFGQDQISSFEVEEDLSKFDL